MIYLIYGEDTYRSREKMRQLLAFFSKKSSGFAFFKIEGENFSGAELEELVKSQTLFEKKYVVECSRLLENPEAKGFIEKNIKDVAGSKNIFLFWEEKLSAKLLDLFKKHAEKIQEFKPFSLPQTKKWVKAGADFLGLEIDATAVNTLAEEHGSDLWAIKAELEKLALESDTLARTKTLAGKKEKISGADAPINIFHLTDAFGSRNKKQAWILYQKALVSGLPAEEVFWKLAWQVKNILLVKRLCKEQKMGLPAIKKESKLNPFVARNCFNFSNKFEAKELQNMYSRLVELYHNVRKGKAEFETGVERFLLG
jgi:DNA polymerase III delta subunit